MIQGLLVGLLAFGSACVVDTTRPAGVPIRCSQNVPACPDGLVCNGTTGNCEAPPAGGVSFSGVRVTPFEPQPGDTLVAWPMSLRESDGGTGGLRVVWRGGDGGVISEGISPRLDLADAGLGQGASITAEIVGAAADGGTYIRASCTRLVSERAGRWEASRPPRGTMVGPDESAPTTILDPAQHRVVALVGPQVWEFDLERARPNAALGTPPDDGEFVRWRQLRPSASVPQVAATAHDGARGLVALSESPSTLALDRGCERWTGLSAGGTNPFPRTESGAVTDAARNRIVVFGGFDASGARGDVHFLRRTPGGTSTWEAVAPQGSPVARGGHVAVLDTAREALVVIGGATCGAGCVTRTLVVNNAVQALSLDSAAPQWSDLAPSGQPPAFYRATAAFDSLRTRVLVWGGCTDVACGQRRQELWALATLAGAETWSPLVTTSPPPAGPATALYDAFEDELLLLVKPPLGSTQVYALALAASPPTWRRLDPNPGPRSGHGAAVVAGNLVVYGGMETEDGPPTDDRVWYWDTAHWEVIPLAGGPGPRAFMGLGSDGAGGLLLHAGWNSGQENQADLWRLILGDAPGWTSLTLGGAPAARSGHAPAFLPARATSFPVMRFFGGAGLTSHRIDGADLSSQSGTLSWAQLGGAAPTPARAMHATVYEPSTDLVVLIGGEDDSSTQLGEIWTSPAQGAAAWTRETDISPALPAVSWHAAAALGSGRIVVYGSEPNQLLLLCRTGTTPGSWRWVDITPADTEIRPCGYLAPTATYDSESDALVLFGGGRGHDPHCDAVWTFTPASELLCP